MIIKSISKKDINIMVSIERENFPDPWSFKTLYYEVIKNDKSHFFGAYKDDILIGYLGFWFFGDNIDIINIAITNDYKRQGVASKLFDSLIVMAKEIKPKTITLEVNVNNIAAINLYIKLGFIIIRTIKKYYHKTKEDAFMMQKEVYYE